MIKFTFPKDIQWDMHFSPYSFAHPVLLSGDNQCYQFLIYVVYVSKYILLPFHFRINIENVMGACDIQRLTFIFEPKSEGGWSASNLPQHPWSPQPTLSPDLRLRGTACLDPGPPWGCFPPGWQLCSSHGLPWILSVCSNPWNQDSALENIPALPSCITAWMLQCLFTGLVIHL